MWSLYDPPEDDQGQDTDEPGDPAELEPLPDCPTLTDCPYCGSRDPRTCGCFDCSDKWPYMEE